MCLHHSPLHLSYIHFPNNTHFCAHCRIWSFTLDSIHCLFVVLINNIFQVFLYLVLLLEAKQYKFNLSLEWYIDELYQLWHDWNLWFHRSDSYSHSFILKADVCFYTLHTHTHKRYFIILIWSSILPRNVLVFIGFWIIYCSVNYFNCDGKSIHIVLLFWVLHTPVFNHKVVFVRLCKIPIEKVTHT